MEVFSAFGIVAAFEPTDSEAFRVRILDTALKLCLWHLFDARHRSAAKAKTGRTPVRVSAKHFITCVTALEAAVHAESGVARRKQTLAAWLISKTLKF